MGDQKYCFRYVDDSETAEGVIDAGDPAHAAVLILQQQGSGDIPRWKRHNIPESGIATAPGDAEFVEFKRINVFSLDIRQQGSRKRKSVCVWL